MLIRCRILLAAMLAAVLAWTPFAYAADESPAAPAVASVAAPAASEPDARTALDTRIQDAKADVIQLNRDLLVLEEELLFPAGTQVAVFVSMDVGKLFELDSEFKDTASRVLGG